MQLREYVPRLYNKFFNLIKMSWLQWLRFYFLAFIADNLEFLKLNFSVFVSPM